MNRGDRKLTFLERYRISMLFMIPSAIHQLVHLKNLDRKRLASVDMIHSGAAYLPPQLMHRLQGMVKDTTEISDGTHYDLPLVSSIDI